LSFILHLNFL